MLQKISRMIKYELGRVLISKKIKKGKVYLNPGVLGPSFEFVPIGTWEWPFWVPDPRLSFGLFWTPFLRFFESRLALRRVFNPYSKN